MIALYCRTSTDDQAERNTIQGQLEFLRDYVRLYHLGLAREYLDDGVTGTLPLDERPGGHHMLQDAALGLFQTVIVYRLDRLGRSLQATLDAYQRLESYKVVIKSATEPFDTSTPIGKFLFQLLGSFAELEKSTITDRMTLGKARTARTGKWVTGLIPFGYESDPEGKLIPHPEESRIVQELFSRIGKGSTSMGEAARLNRLSVPRIKRYPNGVVKPALGWVSSSIRYIIHNPVYKGECTVATRHGDVEVPVPSLVEPELWEQANAALKRGNALPKGNQTREYLLTGLLVCGLCKQKMFGNVSSNGKGWHKHYYRCGKRHLGYDGVAPRCTLPALAAEEAEELVWQKCVEVINDPQPILADLQERLAQYFEMAPSCQELQFTTQQALLSKAQERDRIRYLFIRGMLSPDEMELQYALVESEISALRKDLDNLQTQSDMGGLYQEYYDKASMLVRAFREQLEHPTIEQKRLIFQRFIARIEAHPGVLRCKFLLSPEWVEAPSSTLKRSVGYTLFGINPDDFVYSIEAHYKPKCGGRHVRS